VDQSLPDRPGRAENAYTSLYLNRHFLTTFKLFVGIFVLGATDRRFYSTSPAKREVRGAKV